MSASRGHVSLRIVGVGFENAVWESDMRKEGSTRKEGRQEALSVRALRRGRLNRDE
jgi:hypothetical protein